MSILGPYDHFPGIVQRAASFVDLQVRVRSPQERGFRFWVHDNLNDLYEDPVGSGVGGSRANITTMDAPLHGRAGSLSALIRARGQNSLSGENMKGTCRFVFDPEDFVVSDDTQLYVAIQPILQTIAAPGLPVVQGAVNTGDAILGGFLVLPPASFFGQAEPTLMIAGLAPAGCGANTGGTGAPNLAEGVTPAATFDDLDQQGNTRPMHVVLPRPATSYTIRNQGAEPLLFAPGWNMPWVQVAAGAEHTMFGSAKEFLLASLDTAAAFTAVPFAIQANIGLGPRKGP